MFMELKLNINSAGTEHFVSIVEAVRGLENKSYEERRCPEESQFWGAGKLVKEDSWEFQAIRKPQLSLPDTARLGNGESVEEKWTNIAPTETP